MTPADIFEDLPDPFAVCQRDARDKSELHHAAVNALIDMCGFLGWLVMVPDLQPYGWGRPDLLIEFPGLRPWLIEYKSGRQDGPHLRQSLVQTYGYAATLTALNIPLDRAYLILADRVAPRPALIPPPLDTIRITNPTDFLVDLAKATGIPEDVSDDDLVLPPDIAHLFERTAP